MGFFGAQARKARGLGYRPARNQAAALKIEPRGTQRIRCPATLAQSSLGYLISRYAALFPS